MSIYHGSKMQLDTLLFLLSPPLLVAILHVLIRFLRRRVTELFENKKPHGYVKAREALGIPDRSSNHEIALSLYDMVKMDGAGRWPPRANHSTWPAPLQPYKDIYLELAPLLPCLDPTLDDDANNKRRHHYRSQMRKLLRERVNIALVEELLTSFEQETTSELSRECFNGFYCCIAVLRHAYRYVSSVR